MVLFSRFTHTTPKTGIGTKRLNLELYYDENTYYLKIYVSADKVNEYKKRYCLLKGNDVDEFAGHCDMARFFSDYVSMMRCNQNPLVQGLMVRVDKPKDKKREHSVGVIAIKFKGVVENKNLSGKDSESAYYYINPSEFYKIRLWIERELTILSLLARLGLLKNQNE